MAFLTCLVLWAGSPSPSLAQTTELVGTNSGKLEVTASGAAKYSIPIAVPVGTAGVQPKLTLQYNSQSGNSHLGMRWSLDGVDSISRCATNDYLDNPNNGGVGIDPVDFDDNDKFCLGNRRLVNVDGAYGADGTEYRTVLETFAKIVSHGDTAGSPTSFTVYKKNGDVLTYGATANSRYVGQHRPQVLTWALTRITDVNGNYISFTYSHYSTNFDGAFADNFFNDFHLVRIDYTGNDADNLAPYNHIEFLYDDLNGGLHIKYTSQELNMLTKRLINIKVYAEGNLYRNYHLSYEPFNYPVNSSTRISSITECANDTTCLKPTVFGWSPDGQIDFNEVSLGNTSGITGAAWYGQSVGATGDFNGDGRTDLYVLPTDEYGRSRGEAADHVWLGQADGTFSDVSLGTGSGITGSTWIDYKVGATGDFNGDGRTDLYLLKVDDKERSNGNANDTVWLANSDGTFTEVALGATSGISGPAMEDYAIKTSGDFNGDGLADLYLMKVDEHGRSTGNANDVVWLASGDGTFTTVSLGVSSGITGSTMEGYAVKAAGDFNGDRLTDLYLMKVDEYGRSTGDSNDTVWLSNGGGTFTSVALGTASGIRGASWASQNVVGIGDFNRDGLTDLFLVPTDENGLSNGNAIDHFWYARGDGTFSDIFGAAGFGPLVDTISGMAVAATGDFSGDGFTDIFMMDDSGFCEGVAENITIYFQPNYCLDLLLENHSISARGDFNGDGLTDLYLMYTDAYRRSIGSASDFVLLTKFPNRDRLTKVTNSHGQISEIVYKNLTDNSVYTKGTGATYPVQDAIPAGWVVAEVKTDNSAGGQNSKTYTYEGARRHLKGAGGLGFAKVTVTDVPTGISTETTYSQDWAQHLQGVMTGKKIIAPDSTVLSDRTVSWQVREIDDAQSNVASYFRYFDAVTTVSRDLNGAFVSQVIEASTYDDYGFPTQMIVTTQNEAGTESYTKITANTYNHDTTNWRLGQVTQASVTHQAPGQSDKVRSSAFTYYTSGQLQSETIEPGSPLFHTKTYARNAFGAVTSITETWGSTATDGIAATSRTTSYTYDNKVRYQTSETNPLGHTQTTAYHAILGLPVSTTGPNGLTTSWDYDVFGRVILETRADGTTTTTNRAFCGDAVVCPTDGAYQTETLVSGGGSSIVYSDKLDRQIRQQSVIASLWSIVDTTYDALGRVSQKSEPYFSGDTIHWTTTQYDILSRPTLSTKPDASTQSASYNGLTLISTNELNHTKTATSDVMGRVVSVIDNAGQAITYSYDPLGQMLSMTGDGKVNSYTYDVRGFKLSDTDPDKGTWTYSYNALGLVVEQTDAKGQLTAMTYDVLGRMLTRIDDASAADPTLRTATWTYDSATTGIGKLHTVTSNSYAQENSYDTLGRPVSSSETIESNLFTSSTTYDAYSRPLTMTYPSGITIKNSYDGNGALSLVQDNAGSTTYWQRQEADARGNITKFTLGNGVETLRSYEIETGDLTGIYSSKDSTVIQDLAYSFNDLGHLTSRTDTRTNQSESFVYDNLNRVVQIDTVLNGGSPTTVTMTYGATGNITSKSDVGAYTYGQVQAGCTSGFAGPQAVTQVTGIKNASYCYDANGNMTSGDGRDVVYSPFDKPVMLIKGTNTVSFTYGPDRMRITRSDQTATGTKTTYYAGSKSYEKIILSGETREKHYIGNFAVITKMTNSGGGLLSTDYMHQDHLGSTETITDSSGAVVQRMSFDAWGKRREINWQPMSEAAILAFDNSLTTGGFTGHEMIDEIGLVHMNGRVYDPELARFQSADPIMENIYNLQSFNRYAYVFNSPLSYTDPSGYCGPGCHGGDSANVPLNQTHADYWGMIAEPAYYSTPLYGHNNLLDPLEVIGDLDYGFGNGSQGSGGSNSFDTGGWWWSGNYVYGLTFHADLYFSPGIYDICIGCTAIGNTQGVPDIQLPTGYNPASSAQQGIAATGVADTSTGSAFSVSSGNFAASTSTGAYGSMYGADGTAGSWLNTLDNIQLGLDVAGLTPGVGIVPDALNVVISGFRGNLGEAALSLGAMLPLAGLAVGAGKTGAKGVSRVGKGPDFVVSPGGTAFPVPKGATGPTSVINPSGKTTGSAFTGGKGGTNGQVDSMRIMNPTSPRGKSPGYPNGYIKYQNKARQGVDPYTGRTISNKGSHIPIQ